MTLAAQAKEIYLLKNRERWQQLSKIRSDARIANAKKKKRNRIKRTHLRSFSHDRLLTLAVALSRRHGRLLARLGLLLGRDGTVARADGREVDAWVGDCHADSGDGDHPGAVPSVKVTRHIVAGVGTHIPSRTRNSSSLRMSSPPQPPAISGRLLQ